MGVEGFVSQYDTLVPFEPFVLRRVGQPFYNVSDLDMPTLMGDQDNLRANLHSYIQGFAPEVRDIFDNFDFYNVVERLHEINPNARLTMHGQELNAESHAICKADRLIKGQDVRNIILGNTLSEDGLLAKLFDYMLSNPPFGVEWNKVEKEVRREAEQMGFAGRFGPGLRRVSDGCLLFLLHLISKMRPAEQGGSRIGIVLNGSPLFTGGAGSGESDIRRYVLESDLVEAIVTLPTDMFYNTGISTYVWILSNKKPTERRGHVQLIDASSFWQKMRKSLGSKRKELSDEHIRDITRVFGNFLELEQAVVIDAQGKETARVMLFPDAPVPQAPTGGKVKPLRDEAGNIILAQKGKLKGEQQPDASLRDTENVPLSNDVVPTSRVRCYRTHRTPGSITTRPRSATKSGSTATSTSSNRRVRGPRLMRISSVPPTASSR